MYDHFDDRYIAPTPDFESVDRSAIRPIASHIQKRLLLNLASFATAIDATEKAEITTEMIVCCSALSLLTISCLTDDSTFTESAKDLMRKLP